MLQTESMSVATMCPRKRKRRMVEVWGSKARPRIRFPRGYQPADQVAWLRELLSDNRYQDWLVPEVTIPETFVGSIGMVLSHPGRNRSW